MNLFKRDTFVTGVGFMLLSGVGLAVVGLFGKLGANDLSLTAIVFWRFFFAALFGGIVIGSMGKLRGGVHIDHVKAQLVRMLFVLGSQYSFFYYLERSSLLNAMVLLNTGPLFIPLIERGVFRQRVGRSTWIGLIVAFVGVLCILQPDSDLWSISSLIGLLAGLCQGMSQVVFGVTSRAERSEHGVFLLLCFCVCGSFIPYALSGFQGSEGTSMGWVTMFLLVMGLGIGSVCNQLARAEAYQYASPSRLATFLYISVVISGLLDWLIFGNIPNRLSILGAFLVICGGVLKIYLRRRALGMRG